MGEDRTEKGLEEQLRKALASEETEEHGNPGLRRLLRRRPERIPLSFI